MPRLLSYKAFFAHGTDSIRAKLEPDFLAVNNKCFGLQVRLPYFLGMALGEADIAAVLFAFAGDITFLHSVSRSSR